MRYSALLYSVVVVGMLGTGTPASGQALAAAPRVPVSAPNPGITNEASRPPIIVIGFVGGYVKRDDTSHTAVQVAARIREDYPSAVYVTTFANHQGERAHQAILRELDANHAGKLSPEEKRNARIVIYGHSWAARRRWHLRMS